MEFSARWVLVKLPLLKSVLRTGVFPIVLSRKVAAAATAYLALTLLVIFHCPRDKMGGDAVNYCHCSCLRSLV